ALAPPSSSPAVARSQVSPATAALQKARQRAMPSAADRRWRGCMGRVGVFIGVLRMDDGYRAVAEGLALDLDPAGPAPASGTTTTPRLVTQPGKRARTHHAAATRGGR